MSDEILELEFYTCPECKNNFYVNDIGDMQDLNRPEFCPYCGIGFEFVEEEDDEG